MQSNRQDASTVMCTDCPSSPMKSPISSRPTEGNPAIYREISTPTEVQIPHNHFYKSLWSWFITWFPSHKSADGSTDAAPITRSHNQSTLCKGAALLIEQITLIYLFTLTLYSTDYSCNLMLSHVQCPRDATPDIAEIPLQSLGFCKGAQAIPLLC